MSTRLNDRRRQSSAGDVPARFGLLLAGLVLAAGCRTQGPKPAPKASVSPAPAPTAAAKAGPVDDTVALHPRVKFETTKGSIVCELDGVNAPAPTLHFLQYVQRGFYDNTVFHRVLMDSMIQGGGYGPDMTPKPATLSAPMPDRWDNDLPNKRGTISVIRGQGPAGTGSAEYFINVVDNHRLDSGPPRGLASVFGKVIDGMEVVDAIRRVPVTTHPNYAEGRSAVVPADPVIVTSVKLLTPLAVEKLQAAAEALPTPESRINDLLAQLAADAGQPEVKTASGLRYVDQRMGRGAVPLAADLVEFQYRGTLVNGAQFESTYDKQPAIRKVADLIPGLQEALTSMKEGGKRTVVIPPELAFGTGGIPGYIPGDSTVVFELELLAIR